MPFETKLCFDATVALHPEVPGRFCQDRSRLNLRHFFVSPHYRHTAESYIWHKETIDEGDVGAADEHRKGPLHGEQGRSVNIEPIDLFRPAPTDSNLDTEISDDPRSFSSFTRAHLL